jgi:hypothetical protein
MKFNKNSIFNNEIKKKTNNKKKGMSMLKKTLHMGMPTH